MSTEPHPDAVSTEDTARLAHLGFEVGDPMGVHDRCFYSFRFGSA